MEGVYAIVYCDGDMISSSEKILFECPSVSKVVIISEDMLFDVLKKTIIDATGGCIFLLEYFKHQPIYVGNDCVKYNNKCLIELDATFDRYSNEIFVMLHKPRKPRFADETIVLVHEKFM
ncbi:hypothetical protein GmHk_04G010153 [Glycine max]|nr:hypothetical protein GmHk_04G010153 [Glycine max]